MNISPHEAEEALAAIQQARDKTRNAYGYNGYYLIVWGLVLFFGFLANQYIHTALLAWIWGGLSLLGCIVSAVLGITQSNQVRSNIGARIAFFYLALVVFAALWLFVAQPLSLKQGILLGVTIYMFGGAAIGIFTRTISTIVGCVAITALSVAGYYLLPAYFFLWLAICCGLAMVGIGLTLRIGWR